MILSLKAAGPIEPEGRERVCKEGSEKRSAAFDESRPRSAEDDLLRGGGVRRRV